MHKRPILIAMLALALLGTSCGRGSSDDPQERISSLRTLGVAVLNQLVVTPSPEGQARSKTTIRLYAAIPLGTQGSIKPFKDKSTSGSGGTFTVSPEAIMVDAASANYQDYNSFRIFSESATIPLPTLTELGSAAGSFTGSQLRYGLTVATATEHEDVVGNILIMPEGAAETRWTNPTIELPDLNQNSAVSIANDIELRADVDNINSESLKIGWFVSAGEVANRHAAQTVWTLKYTGPATVIAVVHGTKSRGFGFKVTDIRAE